MIVKLSNVESVIFENEIVRQELPHFEAFFQQWTLARRMPALAGLKKRTLLDLLNSLERSDLETLSRIYGETVSSEPIDPRLVRHVEGDLLNLEDSLSQMSDYRDFCVTRNGDAVTVTFWR